MKKDILGVQFDDVTPAQAVDAACALLADGAFHYIVTPNPEFILAAEKDEEFRTILNRADLTLADGVGVAHAARLLGRPLQARVPGIDFAAQLLDTLCRSGRAPRLFLLGAKPGVAQEAGERLVQAYPGLVLCGARDGYFDEDAPVVREIAQAQPDLVFVCLGAPKQERWMVRCGPLTGCRLCVGLGGALDVFAGRVQRAPERWRKLGLEWAYRLVTQPERAGRMAKLPLVLVKAGAARLTQGAR